jgi:hypothetical protein
VLDYGLGEVKDMPKRERDYWWKVCERIREQRTRTS